MGFILTPLFLFLFKRLFVYLIYNSDTLGGINMEITVDFKKEMISYFNEKISKGEKLSLEEKICNMLYRRPKSFMLLHAIATAGILTAVMFYLRGLI